MADLTDADFNPWAKKENVTSNLTNADLDPWATPDTSKSTLGAFGRGLLRVPENLVASGIMAVQGAEGPSVTNRGVGDRFVNLVDERNKALAKEYEGTGDFIPGIISKQEVAGLGQNLGFMGASMGGTVAGAVAALPIPIPGARVAGGLAGGYAAGSRIQGYSAMNDWLNKKNEESLKLNNRPLSPEEETAFKSQYTELAKESGFWEGAPEAAGNVAEIALLGGKRLLTKTPGPLGAAAKLIPDSVAMKVAKAIARLGGVFGVEELTETITGLEQHNVEVKAGMLNEPLREWTNPDDILKSAKEVLGSTLLLTGFMGAGGLAANKLSKPSPVIESLKADPLNQQLETMIAEDKENSEAIKIPVIPVQPTPVSAPVIPPVAPVATQTEEAAPLPLPEEKVATEVIEQAPEIIPETVAAPVIPEQRLVPRDVADVWTPEKRLALDKERFPERLPTPGAQVIPKVEAKVEPPPAEIVETGATSEGKPIESKLTETADSIIINMMEVPVNQRRSGIGSQFLSDLKKRSDETGKDITLTALKGTEGFYEKNGFIKYGEDPLNGNPYYGYKSQSPSPLPEVGAKVAAAEKIAEVPPTPTENWSVSRPSNVKGRTAEAKQAEFNDELYRRKKAYEDAKTEAEKYGYGKQGKAVEVFPAEAPVIPTTPRNDEEVKAKIAERNIPPETTPKAVGGIKLKSPTEIIRYFIYNDSPPDLWFHGSSKEGFSLTGRGERGSRTAGDGLYVANEALQAHDYAHNINRVFPIKIDDLAAYFDVSKEKNINELANRVWKENKHNIGYMDIDDLKDTLRVDGFQGDNVYENRIIQETLDDLGYDVVINGDVKTEAIILNKDLARIVHEYDVPKKYQHEERVTPERIERSVKKDPTTLQEYLDVKYRELPTTEKFALLKDPQKIETLKTQWTEEFTNKTLPNPSRPPEGKGTTATRAKIAERKASKQTFKEFLKVKGINPNIGNEASQLYDATRHKELLAEWKGQTTPATAIIPAPASAEATVTTVPKLSKQEKARTGREAQYEVTIQEQTIIGGRKVAEPVEKVLTVTAKSPQSARKSVIDSGHPGKIINITKISSLAKEMFGETKGETTNEDMARRSQLQASQASQTSDQAASVSNAGLLTKDATVRPERNQSDYQILRDKLVSLLPPQSGDIDFQAVQVNGKNADFIKGIAGIFGSKVQFFQSETPGLRDRFLGFVDQEAAPDTIFLNIQSPAPHLQTLGHELMHQLQANDPELYRAFRIALDPLMKNVSGYKQIAIADGSYKNDYQLGREFTAEFIEHRFMDQKFWDGMIEKNPSVFSRVMQYIKNILDRVKEYIEQGRNIDSDYISDLNKARQIAVLTLTKYRSRQTARGAKDVSGDTFMPSKISPSTTQPASWDSPEETWRTKAFYKIFDKFNDAQAMFDAIKKWMNNSFFEDNDVKNPMLQLRAYPKIRADQIRRFMEGEVAEATKKQESLKVKREELETYMHNLIAEDVNKNLLQQHEDKIAEENLNRPEENQKDIDPRYVEGMSGIKTKDARAYLKALDPATRLKYDAAAKLWWKMGESNREAAILYMLESPATMAEFAAKNPRWLPLYRKMGEQESNTYEGFGEGFSTTGSISKRRVGSEREVVNPIANIIMQRLKIISRGEKNKADQAFTELVKMAPNEDWWKPAKPRIREFMITSGPSKGTMEKAVDDTYKHDKNVIMARFLEGGKKDKVTGMIDPMTLKIVERGVEFNEHNVRAMRMAQALKNADIDSLGTILGASAEVTRFIARANTQWSPTFGPANFVRDVQFALLNLTNTPLKGKQGQVMQGLPAALGVIYSELRARRNGTHSTHPMSAIYDRFQKAGGQQEYGMMFGTSDEMSAYVDQLVSNKPKEKTFANVAKTATMKITENPFMRWLSDVNTTLENAVRLSVFDKGIKNGMSDPQAAALANSITIDFSKKGQIATQAGALFAFFNASAQGGLKTYQTLTGPKGKQIIAGGIALGAINTLVLAAAGFGDDEPPEFVKERNLIIPTGGKSYKTIPFPLGMHILPNLGRLLTEEIMNVSKGESINPIKKVAQFTDLLADAFNPFGAGGLSVQTFTPSPLRPFVSLAENKDWNQQQISRPNFSSLKPTPGFQRSKDIASVAAQGIAKALNILTGGTKASPGLLSPTADQIDFLVGQATGGLGRELIKIQSIAGALYEGEEVPAYKIPLVGRFHGSTEGAAQESQRFYNNIKLLNRHELEIKQRIKDREPVNEYLKSNPEARYRKMADKVENSIRQLMDRKRHMVERDANKDSIRNMNNLIAAQMKKFNQTIEQAER